MSVNKYLKDAMRESLEEVLIIGREIDGRIYVHSNVPLLSEQLLMMKMVEQEIVISSLRDE